MAKGLAHAQNTTDFGILEFQGMRKMLAEHSRYTNDLLFPYIIILKVYRTKGHVVVL